MRRNRPHLVLVIAACVHVLGSASGVLAVTTDHAVTADHLKCFKAKETSGPGRFQATIGSLASGVGLPLERGCSIKGPPDLVCAPVSKANVVPTPPGGGPTGATTKFLCYKLRCPNHPPKEQPPKEKPMNLTARDQPPSMNLMAKDQFGVHTFALGGAKLLCAPASPSGAFLDPDATL